MLKINRIRLVNFSYNNNNRHIIDECFDFYGGENALLSLANGGGKSVLVQAMLQPILPKVSMLGRKFGDFFTAKKTPSYIMTEWKLDDEAGYLLSGIAVTSRTSQFENEEEESVDIRYFTFSCYYESANNFDIKHIPVTEQIGSSVRIASFHEFKKLLQKESGKSQSEINVYDSSREEQSQYDRKLNSYGISKEEWKELILNINQAEHGVSEVFSECRTSRKVMEQWVIKYIEKVLNKSTDSDVSDHKKLEKMMAQVAQALVDNEKYIREYQAIGGFSSELNTIYSSTKEVLLKLDDEDGLKKEIGGGYQVLKNEEVRLAEELVNIDTRIIEIGQEIEAILLEEKSQEIYKCNEELQEVDEKLAKLDESIKKHSSKLIQKKYELDMQKAAKKFGKIIEKEKTIAELKQRLENASKDQEALLDKLNRIKFSLKLAYDEKILGISKEIENTDTELKRVWEETEKNRTDLNKCHVNINEQNKKLGGVETEVSNFEKEEPGILQSLNIQIYRNFLLKELDEKDISKVKLQLLIERKEAEALLEQRRHESDELKNLVADILGKKEELNNKRTELEVAKADIAIRIKGYKDEEQKVLKALERFGVNPNYMFNQGYLVKEAKEYLNDWENKAYNLKMETSEIEKQIHGIESGESYLPASFIALLKENNLQCYTGEKYLREISEDDKNKLIMGNPILPYALIATEKEIPLIEKYAKDLELSQVIPVIRYSGKDKKMAPGHDDVQFISSSKNITLGNDGIENFVKNLLGKRENSLDELEKANEVIERVNADYQIIINFKWTEIQVSELEDERKINEEEISKNDQAIENCRTELEVVSRRQEELEALIGASNVEIVEKQNRIKGFEDYLDKNDKYIKNVRLYNEIQNLINTLETSIRKHEEEKSRLAEKENGIKSLLNSRITARKDIENKLLEVGGALEVEPISGDITELEGRLTAYKAKQNNDIADLDDQIKRCKKDIQDFEKDIKKLKLESDEYKNIEYSENEEAELETICDKLDKEVVSLKRDVNDCLIRRSSIETKKQGAHNALGGKTVIPVHMIKGNFSKRSEAAKREMFDCGEKKDKIQKDNIALTKLVVKVETEIKEIKNITEDIKQKSFEEVKTSIDSSLLGYSNSRKSTDEAIAASGKKSLKFLNTYINFEEGTVKEAVKGLQYQIEKLERSYDKYYYMSERIEYYFDQLSQILKIMESKMLQLEHSQKDLTEHAFIEAKRIYHEIPKISENSAVEIDGVRKRVLEIQYDEMENELQAREKMGSYIRECLKSITLQIKGNEDENKLRRDIEKYMSTKELLNIISSLENCKVKAFKVDLNEKNRRMMPWEDIIVKNSGGEKFVAYFSLLVALISYSRKQIKGYEAFKRKEESKVLIMDNPFGPITSGHLLKPMFDIAKKYNTQLICLSDIKQGSVMNSFDLIYMIRIRQNMMKEDFLELEPLHLKELKQDEKLENAHFYGKIEQLSLFE